MIFSKKIETHNRTSFWTMNLVLCGLLSLISLISRIYLGESPLRALALAVTAYCATLAILVLLRSIYRSSFSKSSLTLPEFVKICLLSLVAACLHASSIACVTRLLNHFTPMHWHFSQWTFHERFYLLVIILWPMYFGWSLGYFWVRAEFLIIEQERLGRREKTEAQKMELQLLRFQLDPHFLFNSLNGIVSEIHSDPDAASKMVLELSSYLKYSLDHRGEMISRLSSELDATASYLRIQKTRFGERLQTRIDATQLARSRKVPSYILQPLVENAFKHGFSAMPSPWLIELTAETNGEHLVIKVSNQGVLKYSPKVLGVGLESVVGRLAIHYPERNSFTLEQLGEFVVATLDLEGDPCNE